MQRETGEKKKGRWKNEGKGKPPTTELIGKLSKKECFRQNAGVGGRERFWLWGEYSMRGVKQEKAARGTKGPTRKKNGKRRLIGKQTQEASDGRGGTKPDKGLGHTHGSGTWKKKT